jgi:hypothetical protein
MIYLLLNSAIHLKTFPLCEIQLFNSPNITKLPEQCDVRHMYYNNIILKKCIQKINIFIG